MKSNWVRRELELAMAAPHLKGKVVPILIEETEDWTSLNENIGRLQSLRLYNVGKRHELASLKESTSDRDMFIQRIAWVMR